MPFEHGSTKVQAVENELKSRDFILKLLQENLQDAQAHMKMFADQHRTFREFTVGDWVLLRLRLYRQMSVALRRNLKLSSRYYDPLQVTQKIEEVAYKLELPTRSQIYPIFHVSQLKKKSPLPNLLIITSDGTIAPEPEVILERRLKKKRESCEK